MAVKQYDPRYFSQSGRVNDELALAEGDIVRQLGKAEIPRRQFRRDIITRMSLTCHEEIGRVGRGCYEDPLEDVARVGRVGEDVTRKLLS